MTSPTLSVDAPSRLVLHVDDGQGVWGAQRYLLRLAPLLEARGFVQMLAAPPDSELGARWAAEGRALATLPAQPPRVLRDERNRLRLALMASHSTGVASRARSLARLVRAHRVQLISANSHWAHLDAAIAGRLCRTPVLLHLHEEAQPGLAVSLRSASVLLAQATVAVSSDVAARLRPRAAAKTHVIPNGIDPHHFCPGPPDASVRAELAADPDAPVVLSLSRLDPAKRVDHVIDAVARLDRVQLAIVGASTTDAAYERRLMELAHERLGPRARFLGVRTDIPALLRTADAYVLAGSQEGLPLGILEAQATGCPAVAYRAAGVADAITDGVTGLIAAPSEPAELAACLHRVLSDASFRSLLTTAACHQVVDGFSLDRQADRCAAVMRAAAL